eukprot:TRINITY_DN7429_c0_g2_i4.p1 TRINITY_DN7429_c0_g2~~TRINITY_DN7429_c0_g2_i4.p1  ORF type:complete len:255 (+),score=59.59 TRINITY_DN7429_c0_g2_i4:375-1139(+)
MNIGNVEPWRPGEWPEYKPWDDCACNRLPPLITALEKMDEMMEDEEDAAELAWKTYERAQFQRFAWDEGLRVSKDNTPWYPEFYDMIVFNSLSQSQQAQKVQEAIWTALVAPPMNEVREACLRHLMETFQRMFELYSMDDAFIVPETLEETTPLQYAALLASDAGKRQVAALQRGLPEECAMAGHEAAAMSTVINAMLDRGGSFFSDVTVLKQRRAKKRESAIKLEKYVPPRNKLPRGFIPGHWALHTKRELVK